MGTNNKISVRLTPDALIKLNQAKAAGYSTTDFINEMILKSEIRNIHSLRSASVHLAHIESDLEFINDLEIKRNLRKEVTELWRFLK